MRPAALLFDFNGTLSDDEHIQCEIYQEIFAEAGKPLGQAEYFAKLAGLSDPEIVRTWLATAFAGGRHQRRLDKITALERRFSCKE